MTRCTLAREVVLTGNAVRTHGGLVTLRLLPGDEGFVFVRDDTGMRLAATLDNVIAVPNATALGQAGRPEFLFTEHVLSALAGLGYTDAEVHVDCAEVPLLDGSALPIVAALDRWSSNATAGGSRLGPTHAGRWTTPSTIRTRSSAGMRCRWAGMPTGPASRRRGRSPRCARSRRSRLRA
ncbi:MAG: UDP-3-O-acyl-N-acetylglucosamine deacetylase [Armatimonadetes bacterium]|nr:UDP-3-O-acyl-N-acetylglucosamine deacetylase [Armatimonadota bacterium]